MKKLFILLAVLALAFPAFAQVTLTIANGSEPESLDPQMVSSVVDQRLYFGLFEGLLQYDPKTGDPVPAMAESWSISKDYMTYTFKLRRGLVWSDGTPITAKTVVDSWLRNLNPDTGSAYASLLTDIIKGALEYNSGKGKPEDVAIKALDDLTFQFVTKAAAPYVLDMLPHFAFSVVPVHAIQKFGKDWTLPQNFVGNGAFVLKDWKPQDRVVVVKNAKYWDARSVKIDQITYLPVDDNNTVYNMYLKGEVDWSTNPPPLDRVDEAKQRKDYIVNAELGIYYYLFNTMKPPFNDVRVRKAFSLAVDRKELVTKVTKAGQLPAFALTPPMPGAAPYTPTKGIGENVEQAKKLLSDAGYPGGKDFPKVTILYNTSEAHKKIAEYFQQKWSQVLGVQVDLVNQEFKTYLQTRRDGKMGGFDLARAGWIADYRDPYDFLFMFLSDNTDFNDGRWSNPAYDKLIQQANSMKGGPARMKVFQDAEKILIEQDMGIMPIYYYVSQNMIDTTKRGGWYPNVLDVHPMKFMFKK